MLIAHTTDLSGTDEIAFEHAVALAASSSSKLVSVHACVGPAPERELADANALLERWRHPARIEHDRLLHQCCDDVTDTVLDALGRLRPGLVVAATHARVGLDRLISGSIAEGVARNVPAPTLLLPLGGERFVNADTGNIRLARLLVPAGSFNEAQQALAAAEQLVELAGIARAEVLLLHVAANGQPLDIAPSTSRKLTVSQVEARGPIDSAILDTASALGADAVVMVTHGHDGIGDVLLGSHTERVLHQCRRPVLWVRYLKH